jgi:hypothetical protein
MTVSELIELLKAFPPDARVIVAAGEEGYDDTTSAEAIPLRLNVNNKKYYGAHAMARRDQRADETAVLIS